MNIRPIFFILFMLAGIPAALAHSENLPHRIQKWHETYRGLIDQKAKVLTTRAVRTHTIMDPYWRHHTNKDRRRLAALGLSAREMGNN